MKIRMMKCIKQIAFCLFKRAVCFFFIIASVFHFSQSLSIEDPEVYIQEGTLIANNEGSTTANNSESDGEVSEADKETNPKITVTGKEHLYIAGGAIYGLQDAPVEKLKGKADVLSQNAKSTANNELSTKKAVQEHRINPDQKITTQPERNCFYASSISGQTVCVAPGSHYQNFIFHHIIRYISLIRYDEYINPNYNYRYAVSSKNIIDGGGIRPPPFHC